MFSKRPYIPPPFKGQNTDVVFHYAGDTPQVQTIPPGMYADMAIALSSARTAHTGVVSLTPFVYESARNQYLRVAAQLTVEVDALASLTGSGIAVRIGNRDALFARERVRSSSDTETTYELDIEGCLYLHQNDRLSLVFRTCNSTGMEVLCTIVAAQFIAQSEHGLLGRPVV